MTTKRNHQEFLNKLLGKSSQVAQTISLITTSSTTTSTTTTITEITSTTQHSSGTSENTMKRKASLRTTIADTTRLVPSEMKLIKIG